MVIPTKKVYFVQNWLCMVKRALHWGH